jgi:predicted CoA-binding protein
MADEDYSDEFIIDVLQKTKVIALVGASANPARPSHGVMGFLLRRGYRVHPVNPGLAGQLLLDQKVYGTLAEVPEAIDMVDVFRNSANVPAVVDEVLALAALPKFIWMQLGVIHHEAAARAEAAGISVVMNRCPAIEIPRLAI